MNVKQLSLATMVVGGCFSASALELNKPVLHDRAKVQQISMIAKDKAGDEIQFDVSASCGQGHTGIGKIIMSDAAAKDEALLMRFKYGPKAAKQFLHHWQTKASDSAPRLPTVAMVYYPKKGEALSELLSEGKSGAQALASLNDSDAMKVMAVKNEIKDEGGVVVFFACGTRRHPPVALN